MTDAGKKAGRLEKEAAEARKKAEEAEAHLQRAMEEARPGIDRDEMAKIKAAVEAAREAVKEAHKVERKLAKARAGKIFPKRHAQALGAVKNSEKENAEKPEG